MKITRLDKKMLLETIRSTRNVDLLKVLNGELGYCTYIELIQHANNNVTYHVGFVSGIEETGQCITVQMLDVTKDYLTFQFAFYLSSKYEDINPIKLYNDFQKQSKELFEGLGYKTSDFLMDMNEALSNGQFELTNNNGVIPIIEIDYLTFYRGYIDMHTRPHQPTPKIYQYLFILFDKSANTICLKHATNNPYLLYDNEVLAAWDAPYNSLVSVQAMFKDHVIANCFNSFDLQMLKKIAIKMSRFQIVQLPKKRAQKTSFILKKN